MTRQSKFTGALTDAIMEITPSGRQAGIRVLIETDRTPSDIQRELLRAYGGVEPTGDRLRYAATMTPNALEALSRQPWIRSVGLASSRPL
ncbi:MAG: hypothetical protein GC191_00075 [Azospirillum sp.]|nr:hypothetical protein [Azospirillum sp.]